jgi:hypothetical protein
MGVGRGKRGQGGKEEEGEERKRRERGKRAREVVIFLSAYTAFSGEAAFNHFF